MRRSYDFTDGQRGLFRDDENTVPNLVIAREPGPVWGGWWFWEPPVGKTREEDVLDVARAMARLRARIDHEGTC